MQDPTWLMDTPKGLPYNALKVLASNDNLLKSHLLLFHQKPYIAHPQDLMYLKTGSPISGWEFHTISKQGS